MPRNTREWAHRKLIQASQNIDWAGTHIETVRVRYDKEHPEISDSLTKIQAVLEAAQLGIEAIRKSF